MNNNWKNNLGLVEGGVSVILNTILFVAKYWVGYLTGSVAIMADAWHTLADSFTSLVVIIGFWIAGKKADKEHPFGHGRAEIIGAIVIATLLGVVGWNFLKESVSRLYSFRGAVYNLVVIYVFIASVILKEALARFSFWAARKINSESLRGDAWHHRSDAVASGLIVVGAIFARRFWWLDGVLGMGVSLLILYAAYDILNSAVQPIMGEAITAKLEKDIKQITQKVSPLVNSVHHLHIHNYGNHTEITLHVRLPAAIQLGEAHAIATRIERAIKQEKNMEATVHLESE